jgi:hypothetical protein
VTIVLLRLRLRADVRLQHWTLRTRGRITNYGRLFVAILVAWFSFIAHSAYVQYHAYRGTQVLSQIPFTWDELLAGSLRADRLSPKHQIALQSAKEHLRKAEEVGLLDIAKVQIGRTFIALIDGDAAIAEAHLKRAFRCQPNASALQEMLFDLRPIAGRDQAVDMPNPRT